jgi:hypothetical protein
MKNRNAFFTLLYDKKANNFLILLIMLDLVFFVIHYINALTPLLNSDKFSIGIDRGYAEIFQYIKFASVIILMALILKKTGTKSYLAWILVFAYLLVDDSVRLHDRFGSYVAINLNFDPPFGMRLLDIGELLVSACAALILIPALVMAYKRGSTLFKENSENLILLLGLLVFFGIGMDMIHVAIISKIPENLMRGVNSILGLLEDGGEMLSASLILWYSFLLMRRNGDPGVYIRDLFKKEIRESL